jgi:hypothetical protein
MEVFMVKDKELKMQLLEKLMEDMDGRVLENDIKPKSKMVIKAQGDNPEEMKEGIIEKLQGLELPDEEQLAEMSEEVEPEMEDMEEEGEEMMEEEEYPEMDMSEEEEYMSDMPLRMKEKLMKEKMKQKAKQM